MELVEQIRKRLPHGWILRINNETGKYEVCGRSGTVLYVSNDVLKVNEWLHGFLSWETKLVS